MANKILTIFAAVFLIGLVSMIGAYAYKGDSNIKGPNYDADVHEQLEAAIEAEDYDAWLKIRQDNNLPTKGRMFQVINKDNFDKYAELHDANEAGDTAKADAIKAELGLGQGMQNGKARSGMQGNNQGKGSHNGGSFGERSRQFIDSDNNGVCDNYALNHTQN